MSYSLVMNSSLILMTLRLPGVQQEDMTTKATIIQQPVVTNPYKKITAKNQHRAITTNARTQFEPSQNKTSMQQSSLIKG